jgi:hypothetical protein
LEERKHCIEQLSEMRKVRGKGAHVSVVAPSRRCRTLSEVVVRVSALRSASPSALSLKLGPSLQDTKHARSVLTSFELRKRRREKTNLHNDAGRVEHTLLVSVPSLRLASTLSLDLPRLSPREVVEMPVGVDGEDKVPDRERAQVDEHPSDICQEEKQTSKINQLLSGLARGWSMQRRERTSNLPRCDDDEKRRETEDEGEEDERHGRSRLRGDDGDDDNVEGEGDGSRKSERSDEIDQDDELHREAECSAEVSDEEQFEQVVDRRVCITQEPTKEVRIQRLGKIPKGKASY